MVLGRRGQWGGAGGGYTVSLNCSILFVGGACSGLLEPRFFLGFVPFVGRVLQRIQRTAPQLDSEVGKYWKTSV